MFPVLFHLGGFEIQSGTVLVFLGMILSVIYLKNLVKKNGMSIYFVSDHFWIFVASFFIFGRLGGIFLKNEAYQENLLKLLYFWDGSFSFYIGLGGILISLAIISEIKKESFWKRLDLVVFPFLFGMLFISISEFLSGENHGTPSSLPFAMIFPSPDVKYTIPIHPVQLYEFFMILISFIFLNIFARKKRLHGVVSMIGFSLFFASELIAEFFRAVPDLLIFGIKFHLLLFSSALVLSIILFIFKSHKSFYFHHSYH